MKLTTLLCSAVFGLAATMPAQTPDHLVGLTRQIPLLRHHDHWNCVPLNQCPVPMPAGALLPPFAGGTAWDPVRSGAWVSNGNLLAKVDDLCGVQCPPMPIPTLGPNAFVTGMEVVEGPNELWLIDSLGNLHRYTNNCPPAPIAVCNTNLGPGPVQSSTTGLAVDEGQGLVFIAYPDFATGANLVVVTLLANPCVPICRFPVPPCFAAFGVLTGLACDWGRQVLYATDGLNTIAMRYVFAAPCVQIVNFNCCAGPTVVQDRMVGLAVRPGRATSVGQPCANGACPPCPMNHSLVNDPCLGNAQFRLALDQAPAGSLAWCVIGSAPCSAPGVMVPPLCGPVFATPVFGTLGPNPTGGIGACTGATNFNFPLPVIPALAGWVMSSQCVALCIAGGGIGTSVSNCLSFQLQGN
jgi:hypothetical protein